MKKRITIGFILFVCMTGLTCADPFESDFETYLDYTARLFDEYYDAIEPALDDYLEKTMDRWDAYWEEAEPLLDRVFNDPNYSWNDYYNATRSYREEWFQESGKDLDDYVSRTKPIQDIYSQISRALHRDYYNKQKHGGSVSTQEFDELMAEFLRKSREYLAATYIPEPVPRPKPSPGKTYQEALNRRISRYSSETGIYNRNLIGLYAGADLNMDDDLSIGELETFQKNLVMRYSYKANSKALHPVDFLVQGGGDCEDWSIVTAGLLRFWDVSAYIGALRPSNNAAGHAVCLIRYSSPPRNMLYWEVTETYDLDGYYVPIDYQVVGGLSSTLFENWQLTNIYVPEDIYGNWM